MAIAPGTQLGPYEIEAPAGAGGMGEVYRARDTRLGRTVAIKLLPQSLSRDPDRLRRFEQEARAVAALEHPNILGLHDVGTHHDAPYLVSEFLEGESLRERLEAGPLPQRKISDYGLQIARGLAAAHEKNIVHRDLKPENIFITRDGRVKLLDFGLAKLATIQAAAAVGPDGATAMSSESATTPGMIMGTVGYMSPEQVRGSAVDHRSDIFSFGTVLYEMASGSRAFKGDTGVETMTAILKHDPPEFAPERAVPPGLERIIRRCMEKPPDQRFQSAVDLAFAIEALSGTTTSREMALVPLRSRRTAIIGGALALLLVGVLAALGVSRALLPKPAAMHFSILPVAEPLHMALSPDGSKLAYVATDEATGRSQLYLQDVGVATPRSVPDSDGATYPFWSPDSAFLAYFARGKLFKAPVAGGAAQVLATVSSARGGAWSHKGVIIFAPDAGSSMSRVNADGSGAAPLTQLEAGESTHRWPIFLPDGDQYLYYGGNFDYDPRDQKSGLYLGSLKHGTRRLIINARSNVAYADPGFLFFVLSGKLVAARFDSSSGTLAPEQQLVADKVGFQSQVYWGSFTASRNGHIVFSPTVASTFSRLTWYARDGKQIGELGEASTQSNPVISPRDDAVAVDVTDFTTLNTDIWIYELRSGSARRFSFGADEEASAIWSPDGSRIVFRSSLAGANVQLRSVSGLEQAQGIAAVGGGRDILPASWAPSGNTIAASVQHPKGSDIYLIDVATKSIKPLLESGADESHPQIAPDGKWMAYVSNESSLSEVYVTAFPGVTGKWQVSRGGGSEPRWRADGKELYYVGPGGTLYAVPISATAGTFSAGPPLTLFRILARQQVSSTDQYNYTLSRDGKRFLVNRYVPPVSLPPFNIILNATAELEK